MYANGSDNAADPDPKLNPSAADGACAVSGDLEPPGDVTSVDVDPECESSSVLSREDVDLPLDSESVES